MRVKQTADEVKVSGYLKLDGELSQTCAETSIGLISWGDGQVETINTNCSSVRYSGTHTYNTPGTYKLYVRDQDGDMTQTVIEIE